MSRWTRFLEKCLDKLVLKGRYRAIPDRDGRGTYLERGYLWKVSDGKDNKDKPKVNNFNVFLHRFRLSDLSGAFHSHPWKFWISIVLTEGYWEHLIDGSKNWRRPFSIAFRSGATYHWVELPKGKHPFTLFIHGPKTDTWGFFEKGKHVHWETWIKLREAKRLKKSIKKPIKKQEKKARKHGKKV